jgi:ABC-type molybdate transport system substrate-binding protein
MAVFRAGLTLLLLAHATSTLGAAEISFFCTDALAPSMRELVPEFEKASGHHVKTTVANAGTIAARLQAIATETPHSRWRISCYACVIE